MSSLLVEMYIVAVSRCILLIRANKLILLTKAINGTTVSLAGLFA